MVMVLLSDCNLLQVLNSARKRLIISRLVDGIRCPFSDMQNLLHQKVNTNKITYNGQSRVCLIERIVLKIKPYSLQWPGTADWWQTVEMWYQDRMNQDWLVEEVVL